MYLNYLLFIHNFDSVFETLVKFHKLQFMTQNAEKKMHVKQIVVMEGLKKKRETFNGAAHYILAGKGLALQDRKVTRDTFGYSTVLL